MKKIFKILAIIFGVLIISIFIFRTEKVQHIVFGISSLQYAVSQEDVDRVRSLIKQGAEVNAKDKVGETAIYDAASTTNVEILNILIDHGANINEKGRDGNTPLHYAAFWGNTDTALRLIEA